MYREIERERDSRGPVPGLLSAVARYSELMRKRCTESPAASRRLLLLWYVAITATNAITVTSTITTYSYYYYSYLYYHYYHYSHTY